MGGPREILERAISVWNGHDISGWVEQFADDAEFSGPNFKISGSEAAQMFYSVWHDAFPDNQVRSVAIYEDGDTVILQGVFEGTHTGTFGIPEQSPIEATNQKVSIPFAQINTVRNGKVKGLTGFFDLGGLMSQLRAGG
jgi:predicted ester cyclase